MPNSPYDHDRFDVPDPEPDEPPTLDDENLMIIMKGTTYLVGSGGLLTKFVISQELDNELLDILKGHTNADQS